MNEEEISNKIKELQTVLSYQFHDNALLKEALTHPSCYLQKAEKNYERLEFLGDAVLNLVVAELLYIKYKDVLEDKLSSMRAKLVSCDAICLVADKISLADKLILSHGEERNGGRHNQRNIENTMEAIIGASYIDGGIEAAKKIVSSLWEELIQHQEILGIDSKTYLQEWAQKNKYKIPHYSVVNSYGPSHAPIFETKVEIEGCGFAIGVGSNKKEAEKAAANAFLERLGLNK